MRQTLLLLSTCSFLFGSGAIQAQSDNSASWIHLTIDNDSFLFSQTDWYYSSGIYASYRKTIPQENALINFYPNREKKVIRRMGFSHQVYTPLLFNSPIVGLYDRPHAALFQFDYGLSFASSHHLFELQGSLGWMGSALGTGPMLVWFHDLLGYRTPRGWDYEVGNAPVVQLKAIWNRVLFSGRWIDLTFMTEGDLGTVFVNSALGSEFRIGRFLPLDNSLLFNQFTGGSREKGLSELFLIVGGNIEYNFYNSTIQGPFIGADSPHTETPTSWVRNGHIGVGLGGNRIDAMVMINYRSPSTTEAGNHKYISIKLNYRL